MIGIRKPIDEQYPVCVAILRCFSSAERTGSDDSYIWIPEVANGCGESGDQIVRGCLGGGDGQPFLSEPLLKPLDRRWHIGSVSDPGRIRNFYLSWSLQPLAFGWSPERKGRYGTCKERMISSLPIHSSSPTALLPVDSTETRELDLTIPVRPRPVAEPRSSPLFARSGLPARESPHRKGNRIPRGSRRRRRGDLHSCSWLPEPHRSPPTTKCSR